MLNTADDPIDFLSREAAYAGADALDGITLMRAIHDRDATAAAPEHYVLAQVRRAWRFALAAQELETAKAVRIMNALDEVKAEALLRDVVEHARISFRGTPYRAALDEAKRFLGRKQGPPHTPNRSG